MAMKYSPWYAMCRDTGHQWDYFEWYGGRRVLQCNNCKTTRTDVMDNNYEIISRSYRYPNGYSWKDEPHPVKLLRRQLRMEALKLMRSNSSFGVRRTSHLKVVKERRKDERASNQTG
jgi:Zn-finger protein